MSGANTNETGSYDPKPEGWSFLQSRRAVQALADTLTDWRPHVVAGIGTDTALLAMLAAERAGIRQRLAIVTERFDGSTAAAEMSWRKTFAASTSAVFFNGDDRQFALRSGVLPASLASFAVPGHGLDLNTQSALPLPPIEDGLVFLLHAPPGQRTAMIEAAAALTAAHPNVRVLLAAMSLRKDQILPARAAAADPSCDGVAIESGALRACLAQCHVYVHIPNSDGFASGVQAALAAGRPVITTNTPGCRDTVDDAVNGCLVEPGSIADLVQAMRLFASRPDLIKTAARASRLKAERRFDQRDITQQWLEVLALTP